MKYLKRFNESVIYDNPNMRSRAFDFTEMNWSEDVMYSLLETNGDIESILMDVDDLGDYTVEEWIEFFTKVRKEGI